MFQRLKYNENLLMNNKKKPIETLIFKINRLNSHQQNFQIEEKINQIQNIKNDDNQNNNQKMLWGEPTWFLFHTLSHKIKPESFPVIKNELLQLFSNICSKLPCPICAEHASNYLVNNNFFNIQSKEELKRFFFVFHNYVNEKKKYPIFELSELDKKYSSAITINIINNFIKLYQIKYNIPKLFSSNMFRKNISKKIIDWYSVNYNNFEQ